MQYDTGKCLSLFLPATRIMLHVNIILMYMYVYMYVCGESWSPWTIFGSCLVRRLSNADIPSGVEHARSAGGQHLFVNLLTPIDLLNHSNKTLFFECVLIVIDTWKNLEHPMHLKAPVQCLYSFSTFEPQLSLYLPWSARTYWSNSPPNISS